MVELFEHFYAPNSNQLLASLFRADCPFKAAGSIDDDLTAGQVDGMLDLGKAVVLFEFKHFLLSQQVKDAMDRSILDRELRLKLVENEKGEPKAVRQLVNVCRAVRKAVVPTTAGADGSQGGKAVLYPVVVVADPAMEAFSVNSFLNGIFQQYGAEIDGEVRPLTVMTIQELEEVLAHTSAGIFTWEELLDSRFFRDAEETSGRLGRVRLWSVHQAIYDLLSTKRAPSIPNKFRRAQFERVAKEILSIYSGTDADRSPIDS